MFKSYKLVKKSWWQLLLIVILVASQTLLQLELPDYISAMQNILTEATGEITKSEINLILSNGVKMIGISFAIFMLAVGQGLLNSRFVAGLGKAVREELFKKVDSFSLSNVNEFGTASLLTRTMNDTRVVQNFAFMINRVFVMSPIYLIMGSAKLFRLDPVFFYVVIIVLPIVLIVMLATFFITSPIFVKIQEKLDYVTLLFREGLTGVRVVRAFNQEEREKKFFTEANDQMAKTTIKVNRIMSIVQPSVGIFFGIAYYAIYFVGFILIDGSLRGVLTDSSNAISQVMPASMYVQNIMMSFLMLSFSFIMFPQAAASAKRINSVLDVKSTITETTQPKDASLINKGLVVFDNVTFTFSDIEHPTLKNINFTAKPGTITAIVGSTGSGKSSIINLLPRFFDANEGAILFDGHDSKDFKISELRDKMAFVPQTAVLFSGTIRDNIRFGKEDATDEEIWEALKVSQAYDFVSQLEKGLDSPVAQGGKNFSGGQKQRLAIARALVKKPLIYVFDDSFSALDFRTDIRLRTALKSYAKDATIFIVAQRVSSIMDATQILVLNDGQIAGLGSHNELLNTCEVYQEIVSSQLDKDEVIKSRELAKNVLKEGGKA